MKSMQNQKRSQNICMYCMSTTVSKTDLATKPPYQKPHKKKQKEMTFHFSRYSVSPAGKESACNVGDLGSVPGLAKSPGGGHGNPLQHSCLQNSHGQRSLAGYMQSRGCKSRTRLRDTHTYHIYMNSVCCMQVQVLCAYTRIYAIVYVQYTV